MKKSFYKQLHVIVFIIITFLIIILIVFSITITEKPTFVFPFRLTELNLFWKLYSFPIKLMAAVIPVFALFSAIYRSDQINNQFEETKNDDAETQNKEKKDNKINTINSMVYNYNLIMLKSTKRMEQLSNDFKHLQQILDEFRKDNMFNDIISNWEREIFNSYSKPKGPEFITKMDIKISKIWDDFNKKSSREPFLQYIGSITLPELNKESLSIDDRIFILNMWGNNKKYYHPYKLHSVYSEIFSDDRYNNSSIKQYNSYIIDYKVQFGKKIIPKEIGVNEFTGLIMDFFSKLFNVIETTQVEIAIICDFLSSFEKGFAKVKNEKSKGSIDFIDKMITVPKLPDDSFRFKYFSKENIYSHFNIE